MDSIKRILFKDYRYGYELKSGEGISNLEIVVYESWNELKGDSNSHMISIENYNQVAKSIEEEIISFKKEYDSKPVEDYNNFFTVEVESESFYSDYDVYPEFWDMIIEKLRPIMSKTVKNKLY